MDALLDSMPSGSSLAQSLAETPRLRELYDPARHHGPFVIGGDPASWADVARDLDGRGAVRLAFHDRRWRVPRVVFARRPVVHGRTSGAFGGARYLFAGEPHKRYFDAAFDALERCLWHTPPREWHQRGGSYPDLLSRHRSALEAVHDALVDDSSRRIFASLVRGRVESDAGYIRISHHREYDHPVVRARPGDVVVDGGAYTGLSAMRFLYRMRGRGTVVALEPSVASYRRLVRLKLPGLVPLCVGAWHESATLSFCEGGASGRIGREGTSSVHVSPIDTIVRDLGLPRVDLIKLDVEGAESAALDGARETLARHRPKLQVSIYHRKNDLFELPLRLMAELPSSRFYLGHHGFYSTETDLYAIPEERVR